MQRLQWLTTRLLDFIDIFWPWDWAPQPDPRELLGIA